MRRYEFAGGVAVVTGAASGIGAALAVELARRGSRLVLLDRDAERLVKVAAPLDAETRVVDLADGAAVVAVGEEIRAAHPRLSHARTLAPDRCHQAHPIISSAACA